MPTAIETEILELTEFKPKGKDRQKVLESIARAVDDWCADDDKKAKSKQHWEMMSEAAQGWYNDAIDAIEARKAIPEFAEDEEDDEAEGDPEETEDEPEDEEEDGEEDETEGDEPEEEADEESEDAEDETEDEESEDTEEETEEVVTAAVSETGRRGIKAPPPPTKKAKPKVETKVEVKKPAKVVAKTTKEAKEAKTNGKVKVKAKVAKPREREENGISGSEYIRILTIKHPDWTSGEVHAQCKKDGYDVSGLLVSSIRSAAINVCKHLKAEGFRVPKFRQRSSED